jgi:hypothetical protein
MSSAVLTPAHRPSVRASVLAALLALLLPLLVVSGSSPARASTCDATVTAGYGGGGGLEGNPYLICSAAHIAHLAATSGDRDKKFLQTGDIALSSPHTPIGTDFTTSPFAGTYDGGGFTITGLVLDEPTTDDMGLFGVTNGATLTRIRLVGVDVTGQGNVGDLLAWLATRALRTSPSLVQ